jgi:hypothetical protein
MKSITSIATNAMMITQTAKVTAGGAVCGPFNKTAESKIALLMVVPP